MLHFRFSSPKIAVSFTIFVNTTEIHDHNPLFAFRNTITNPHRQVSIHHHGFNSHIIYIYADN